MCLSCLHAFGIYFCSKLTMKKLWFKKSNFSIFQKFVFWGVWILHVSYNMIMHARILSILSKCYEQKQKSTYRKVLHAENSCFYPANIVFKLPTGLLIIRTPPLRIFRRLKIRIFLEFLLFQIFAGNFFQISYYSKNGSKIGLSGGWFLDKIRVSALI